ncbi:ATP-binding protein [Streptosporangium sp. KLBMP 9127]|nr:histidine kinase [Streptosporangium sp. KLBMP 9127]
MRPATNVPLRRAVGLLAGMPTGLAGIGWICLAPAVGPARARRVTAALVRLERTRLATWYDHPVGGGRGGRAYLALRGLLGTLGGYLTITGLFVGVLFLYGGARELVSGDSDLIPLRFPGVHLTGSSWAYGLVLGLVALAASIWWSTRLIAMERHLADRFAGPDRSEAMARRIAELTASRSGIVRAVDDERRRIERDLHDGVQQRGVALAMLLGRARHRADPVLLDQAYTECRLLLDELRDVAWQVYPTALDSLGLHAALAEVADRSAVPVTIEYGPAVRLASEIETAVYFVAREAITNANKHAGAGTIVVDLRLEQGEATVTISDDGRGGAAEDGGGLSGLARRVRALDGTFDVDSPPGGPTKVTARLPCG